MLKIVSYANNLDNKINVTIKMMNSEKVYNNAWIYKILRCHSNAHSQSSGNCCSKCQTFLTKYPAIKRIKMKYIPNPPINMGRGIREVIFIGLNMINTILITIPMS